MKLKRLFTMLVALIATISVMAMDTPKFDEEAYKAEQHKYILREVRFTQDEAKKFFAIYDEMRAKLRQVFNKMRNERRKKLTSDAECRKSIIERDNDGLQLKKIELQYHQKMLKVLPAKKVLDALVAADKFDKKKFEDMNKPKPQPQPQSHNCNKKCDGKKCDGKNN